MKILFGALLLLFVAATLALFAAHNPGYVLVVREPFVLETSLAVFVVILLILFACFHVMARVGTRIIQSPVALERWRQTRRTRKSREAFQSGLLHALGGEWLAAEQSLLASLHGADQPVLVWLALAVVAQRQENSEKRDHYLINAQQQAGEHGFVTRLLQSELLVLDGQHESALATLVDLHSTHPKHPEVARRLLATYLALSDWAGLSHLLKELARHSQLSAAERRPFELAMHRALLDLDLPRNARATLDRAWEAIPDSLKSDHELIAVYARQLQRQQAGDTAASLLAGALEKSWEDKLAQLYGQTETTQPLLQLERALDWLPGHTENPVLLIALATIARRAGQLERAEDWLRQAEKKGHIKDVEAERGRLSEVRGEKDQALAHYRRALENH